MPCRIFYILRMGTRPRLVNDMVLNPPMANRSSRHRLEKGRRDQEPNLVAPSVALWRWCGGLWGTVNASIS